MGSKYDLEYRRSEKDSRMSGSNGVYGYYANPEPVGSIYLPLDRDKRIEEGNGYAHLKVKIGGQLSLAILGNPLFCR